MSAVGQRRAAWKNSYALIWTNAAADRLLRELSQHLRIKATQAELLLEFDDHVRVHPRTRDD